MNRNCSNTFSIRGNFFSERKVKQDSLNSARPWAALNAWLRPYKNATVWLGRWLDPQVVADNHFPELICRWASECVGRGIRPAPEGHFPTEYVFFVFYIVLVWKVLFHQVPASPWSSTRPSFANRTFSGSLLNLFALNLLFALRLGFRSLPM